MQIDPTATIMMGFSGAGAEAKPGTPAKVRIAIPQSAPTQPAGNAAATQQSEQALRELAQVLEPFNISLKFTKDDETGTIVIQLINQGSGETLQQIPNEASLHVAAALHKFQGKIFNSKA